MTTDQTNALVLQREKDGVRRGYGWPRGDFTSQGPLSASRAQSPPGAAGNNSAVSGANREQIKRRNSRPPSILTGYGAIQLSRLFEHLRRKDFGSAHFTDVCGDQHGVLAGPRSEQDIQSCSAARARRGCRKVTPTPAIRHHSRWPWLQAEDPAANLRGRGRDHLGQKEPVR